MYHLFMFCLKCFVFLLSIIVKSNIYVYFFRSISQTLHAKDNKSENSASSRSTDSRNAVGRNKFVVGLIGCGRMGRHLVNCLLKFCDLLPEELIISTRRPETLGDI